VTTPNVTLLAACDLHQWIRRYSACTSQLLILPTKEPVQERVVIVNPELWVSLGSLYE